MRNQLEMRILKLLFIFGIGLFINLIRKPPIKDWLIVFFLKSYFATFIDNLLVRSGYLKYPVNLFRGFDISVLFSYLLFPISCVYFNQVTKKSNVFNIFLKMMLFSLPMTVAEHFLERKTKLIEYRKGWTSLHSFLSISVSFLFVRTMMGIIRKFADKDSPKNQIA